MDGLNKLIFNFIRFESWLKKRKLKLNIVPPKSKLHIFQLQLELFYKMKKMFGMIQI